MIGYRLSDFVPTKSQDQTAFDNLWNILQQLLLITSGDVNEALSWLTNVDKQYKITDNEYGIGDFLDDLKKKGFLTEDNKTGQLNITAKSEQSIRKSALEEIFGKLKNQERENTRPFIQDKVMSAVLTLGSTDLVIVPIKFL